MAAPDAPSRGPGSRTLIVALLVAAIVIALLPVIVARSRKVQIMRAELAEVLEQCRTRYASAVSASDTAAADAWQPMLDGEHRAGDPTCGPYRRRNMLRTTR